jgi:DNA primase
MPLGFFREMMFSRLRELSGTRLLDIAENQTTLMRTPIAKQVLSTKSPRSNLMRRIMALLFQYPYLAKHVENYAVDIDAIHVAGMDLLQDALRLIALKKPENSAVLLELYRDSPHYKTVYALIGSVLNIPEGGELGEFCGAIEQLIKQAKNSRMDVLIEKVGRGEKLTAAEMQEFKTGGKA